MGPTGLLAEAGDILTGAPDIAGEWVKNADLDIWVSIQNGYPAVPTPLVDIIDQKPDPHPTLGGLEELVDKQAADDIVMNHIILGIDAALGNVSERSPGNECIQPVSEIMEG